MKHYPLEQLKQLHGFQIDAYLMALCGWQNGLQLTFHNRRPRDVFFGENTIPNEFPGVVFSLSDGTNTHTFYRTRGDKTSEKTIELCADKDAFKKYLIAHEIKTPIGETFKVHELDKMIAYATDIGFPVILKPVAGSMGRGVFINLKNIDELKASIESMAANFPEYEDIMIETYFEGEDYRIYVVGDEVVAAYTRVPAYVTGDGKHNIEELIKQKNKQRLENPNTRNKLIKINENLKQFLKNQQLDMNDIPSENEVVYLSNIPNISRGGEPTDVTDELPQHIKDHIVQAVQSIDGLPNVGVDVLINNETNDFTIIEMNSVAVITSHVFPLHDEGIDIPEKILKYYFPDITNKKRSHTHFDYVKTIEMLSTGMYDSLMIKPFNSDQETYKLTFKATVPWANVKTIQAMLQMHDFHGNIIYNENSYQLTITAGNDMNIETLIEHLQKRFLFKDYTVDKSTERILKSGIYIKDSNRAD